MVASAPKNRQPSQNFNISNTYKHIVCMFAKRHLSASGSAIYGKVGVWKKITNNNVLKEKG